MDGLGVVQVCGVVVLLYGELYHMHKSVYLSVVLNMREWVKKKTL